MKVTAKSHILHTLSDATKRRQDRREEKIRDGKKIKRREWKGGQ